MTASGAHAPATACIAAQTAVPGVLLSCRHRRGHCRLLACSSITPVATPAPPRLAVMVHGVQGLPASGKNSESAPKLYVKAAVHVAGHAPIVQPATQQTQLLQTTAKTAPARMVRGAERHWIACDAVCCCRLRHMHSPRPGRPSCSTARLAGDVAATAVAVAHAAARHGADADAQTQAAGV